MNDSFKSFLAFVSGAAVGAVVAWKLLEKKYKQIADDEIESVREVYNKKLQKKSEEQNPAEDSKQSELDTIVEGLGYVAPKHDGKEDKKDMAKDAQIYVIAPEEFGENNDFKTESLTYYADKVLVYNGTDKIVENVDGIVGLSSLNTFGEYEDDSVFVRNEHMKTDFEILLDTRNYSDVVLRKPHLVDDDNDQ